MIPPAPRDRARAAWEFFAKFIASGLFFSVIPARLFSSFAGERRWTGAGLVGTLWGLVLLPWVPQGPLPFFVFYAAALAAAIVLSGTAEKAFGQEDDSRIIIDETVGYWAAAAFLPRHAWPLAAAFVLFRVFDALKPPPVNTLEKLPGGTGIVMDDVAAGIMANLIVQACLRFYR